MADAAAGTRARRTRQPGQSGLGGAAWAEFGETTKTGGGTVRVEAGTALQHPHQRHQQDLHQDRQGEENTVSALDPLIPDPRICCLKHGGLP